MIIWIVAEKGVRKATVESVRNKGVNLQPEMEGGTQTQASGNNANTVRWFLARAEIMVGALFTVVLFLFYWTMDRCGSDVGDDVFNERLSKQIKTVVKGSHKGKGKQPNNRRDQNKQL